MTNPRIITRRHQPKALSMYQGFKPILLYAGIVTACFLILYAALLTVTM